MKGVILKCLAEVVRKNHGDEKWISILKALGLSERKLFYVNDDVNDALVMKAIEETCSQLKSPLQEVADEFGHHWCTEFAPRLYPVYFKAAKNARDFLLKMDEIHVATTRNIAGSQPPRFDYTWKNDSTLVMHYHSSRQLMPLLLGLIKGVGAYYQEELKMVPIGEDKVEVHFVSRGEN